MNFWDKILFGNPFKDWAIAIGIIVVSFSPDQNFKGPGNEKIKKVVS